MTTFDSMTEEERAAVCQKARESREAAHDVDGLVAEIRERLTVKQAEQVRFRLGEMPVNCRRTFQTAMKGRSKKASIRAFCQMCIGWTNLQEEILKCTDLACPLYPHRPSVNMPGETEDVEESHGE